MICLHKTADLIYCVLNPFQTFNVRIFISKALMQNMRKLSLTEREEMLNSEILHKVGLCTQETWRPAVIHADLYFQLSK